MSLLFGVVVVVDDDDDDDDDDAVAASAAAAVWFGLVLFCFYPFPAVHGFCQFY